MIKAVYDNMAQSALENAQRLFSFGAEQSEVVFVMTPDVYYEVFQRRDDTYRLVLDKSYGFFCGIRVFVINEPTMGSILKAALVGTRYYDGMRLGSMILPHGEDKLYRLTNTNPVCFTDSGLTVSFGEEEGAVGRVLERFIRSKVETQDVNAEFDDFLSGFTVAWD